MNIEECIKNVNRMSSDIRIFQAENGGGLSKCQGDEISSFLADVFMMKDSLSAIKMVNDFNLANGITPIYCSGDSLSSDLFELYEQLVDDGRVLVSKLSIDNV